MMQGVLAYKATVLYPRAKRNAITVHPPRSLANFTRGTRSNLAISPVVHLLGRLPFSCRAWNPLLDVATADVSSDAITTWSGARVGLILWPFVLFGMFTWYKNNVDPDAQTKHYVVLLAITNVIYIVVAERLMNVDII